MQNITCHCGNISLEFAELPAAVRDCDCPVCNRLGALWGDFKGSDIRIAMQSESATYRWGDGDYELHHCKTCGCSTHYTAVEGGDEVGVNLRMLDRKLLEAIPVTK